MNRIGWSSWTVLIREILLGLSSFAYLRFSNPRKNLVPSSFPRCGVVWVSGGPLVAEQSLRLWPIKEELSDR